MLERFVKKNKKKKFRLQNTNAKVPLFCLFSEVDQRGTFAVVFIKVGSIQ